MFKILLTGILLSASAQAGTNAPVSRNWTELREKCVGMEPIAGQLNQTLALCRQRGLDANQAGILLEPFYTAAEESLPAYCMITKINEGLSKQASVSSIMMAAEARLNYLRQARQMVSEVVGGTVEEHRKGPRMLVENTGLVLESGLDPAVVKAVIKHNGHRQLGRLAHVMEAAETLHLEGFQTQHIQRVLFDFLDRDLNRHEMFRAVAVLKEGLDSGLDFESVYAGLWVSSE